MQTLRQLRRTRQLTFVDLALLTGIPARVIAEAEYGMRHLSRQEAEAIALVLGLAPTAMLTPSHYPSQPQPQLAQLVVTTGLAAILTLMPLAVEMAPSWQRHWQAITFEQAHPSLAAGSSASPPLPSVDPIQTVAASTRAVPTTVPSPLPPTPDAIAPLVAPVPIRLSPSVSNRFYLDETGPHGCPVQPTSGQVVVTQGYGVGTHAPAHIWGAIDLTVDSDGDGLADPGASWYTPVVATHDGVVKVTMNSYPAGHHVWVLAPDGIWRTGYSHLAIVTVIDGQRVRAGETIGLMGSTGLATGPHLDYQVWRGDVNVDPTELVGCGAPAK
ncbi:MAG: peptidoglycan DD-metalloendopeptidase family protein [Chloroflexus sp.]